MPLISDSAFRSMENFMNALEGTSSIQDILSYRANSSIYHYAIGVEPVDNGVYTLQLYRKQKHRSHLIQGSFRWVSDLDLKMYGSEADQRAMCEVLTALYGLEQMP